MKGVVVWICGRPASGKSTLAARVRDRLRARGVPICVLDSDEVRREVFPWRGYDEHDRDAFYRDLASLAALLSRQGLVVVVAATAHRRAFRDRARTLTDRFVEVYVATDVAECRARDPKQLYAASNRRTLSDLPGAQVAFEAPLSPDVVARGGHDDEAADAIVLMVSA